MARETKEITLFGRHRVVVDVSMLGSRPDGMERCSSASTASCTERAKRLGASPAPVHVGSVIDALDANQPLLVVDPIEDAVATAACCELASEFEVERSPDPPGVGRQSAVGELSDGRDDLLR